MKNKKVLAMALAVGVLATPFANSHASEEEAGFEIFANEGEGATWVGDEGENKPAEKVEKLDGDETQESEGFVNSDYTNKDEAETIKDLKEDPDAVEVEEEEVVSGYKTKADAETAAKEALKNNKINKSYSVSQGSDGRWYYTLSPIAVDTDSNVDNNTQNQTKDEETEKGYETKEEAEKAAKEALKNDEINKSYSVSQGSDGKWYYVLSPVEADEDSKEEEKDKDQKTVKTGQSNARTSNTPKGQTRVTTTNPKTGIAGITSVASVLAAASVAYKQNKKRG